MMSTLGLAAEGMLSASAGFGINPRSGQILDRARRVRRITNAYLDHIALVMQPAYDGARSSPCAAPHPIWTVTAPIRSSSGLSNAVTQSCSGLDAVSAGGDPMRTWRKRTRGTTTERGYGAEHRRIREAVKLVVLSGKATCWRCGRAIHPLEPWDAECQHQLRRPVFGRPGRRHHPGRQDSRCNCSRSSMSSDHKP